MKANKLMIGDWVYSPEGELCKVRMIEGRFEGFVTTDNYAHDDDTFYMYYIEEIRPIPLTAEILEKNGFEKCEIPEIEYIGWRLNEKFSLEVSPASTNDIDGLYWNDDVHIRYVHQLQHVLRLCRIDKEIEL